VNDASRYQPPDFDRPMVRVLEGVNRVFVHGFHRLRVHGRNPLPATGPAILVCNHTSSLDPALLQATTGRKIVWMMAREYLAIPVLSRIFAVLGVIGVDRGSRDSTSTRSALRVLEAGGVLGVFPEGRIERTRELLPFHPGAATLAIRGRATVVPAFIDGTQRRNTVASGWLVPHEAGVWFGDPLVLHEGTRRADPLEATARVRAAVAALAARRG
jgi:1-acyl-sn-glycerol-3-phosphate acyltransferase